MNGEAFVCAQAKPITFFPLRSRMRPMKNNNAAMSGLMLLAVLLSSSAVLAQESETSGDQAAAESAALGTEYTDRGADRCLRCHDEESEFPVFSIFKTRHAVPADKRTPFAQLQCEACHGPGAEHSKKVRPGQKRPPIGNFTPKAIWSVEQQNRVCLDCHGDTHVGWSGSAHERADVGCASCHEIHAVQDHVLTRSEQPSVCYDCHKKARADFFKPSTHPVRFGKVTCSECHNTHGAISASLLSRPTLNETCYKCHAEKRGPFLWEHAPVPEDCALCHSPHGSIHPSLLVKRPPLLCQQCHSQAGHPSVARTGAGLPGATPSGFLLARSCANCHSQVHGSNHPSGVKLMR